MIDGICHLNEKKKLKEIGAFINTAFSITPNIYSPANLKYLFTYPDPIGIVADFLSNYINSNVLTEECSPVFTHCEAEIIKTLLSLVGYPEGDGVFYPGGSLSNLASVVLAVRKENIDLGKSAVIIPEHAHYSIEKSVKICGIRNILKVKTTAKGVVNLDHLKKMTQKVKDDNLNLVYYCCVLGTTNFGTFDPVEDIIEIFKKFYVTPWVHFDAAWGGSVYFSHDRSFYQKISCFSDSITLDFHKFLSAPLLCSALLVKNKSFLWEKEWSDQASYLYNSYQDEKYSLSLKSLQCSREAYAFKLWLMFKYHGFDYFQGLIQKYHHNRKAFKKQLNKNILYVVEPQYFNLCMWFIPKEMEVKESIKAYTREQLEKINRFNIAMYERIVEDGFMKITCSSFNNVAFIRIIVHHANLTENIISEIVAYLYKVHESISAKIDDQHLN